MSEDDITDKELQEGLQDVRNTRYVTHTRLPTYSKLFEYITTGGALPRAIGYLKRLGWFVVEMDENHKHANVLWSEYDEHNPNQRR